MGNLTEEEKQFYKENGYILLKNIFSEEEIRQCCKAYDELFNLKMEQDCNLEATWKGNWRTSLEEVGGTSGAPPQNKTVWFDKVLSIQNLQCHSDHFSKILFNEKLLDSVSDLIGSENILLHHTKAHIKPPGKGAPFPTHQDYHYFPYARDSLVAVFIHLDDSDVENGGLAVFPGSHLLGPQENKSDVPTHHFVDQEKFPLNKATPVKACKGDVLIFSYLLVHGSYPNVSERNRRMLLIQLMAAEDTPLKQVHLSPCHGMVLKGRNVTRNADIHRRHEAV